MSYSITVGNTSGFNCVYDASDGVLRVRRFGPDKVIFNGPATIVIWNDGTKTVVKCHPDDSFDREKGFLLCCAKKLMGNGGRYNDFVRELA